jgi:hypothetical protein
MIPITLVVTLPLTLKGRTLKFVPDRSPDVTFLVPTYLDGIPLDFNDKYPGSSNVTDAWLTHGSNPAVNIFGLPKFKYSRLSRDCDDYLSLIDFTGVVTVFTGEVFTFGDSTAGAVDDGIWVEINRVLVYLQQDPHNPGNGAGYTGTYTGPSGTFPFRIIYIARNDVHSRITITHN